MTSRPAPRLGHTSVTPPVQVKRQGAIATIEFSDPRTRNAWTPEVDEAYIRALNQVDDDSRIRAVVVRGGGGHFCAGRSLADLSAAAPIGGQRQLSHGIDRTRHVRKPMIAAIRGSCAGIGLTLALLCDVRIAADDAVFSTAFARRGLVAGHATGWLLQRLVGHGHASELLLSGRKFDAEEAARIGIVSRVVAAAELGCFVAEYARDIVEHSSPRSMHVIKQQLSDDLDRGYDEALKASAALAAEAFSAGDFVEGVISYCERRSPHFPDLAGRER